jgi:hypothetical protein
VGTRHGSGCGNPDGKLAYSATVARLIEPGDAVATAANIQHSPWMLHLAVAGDLVTALCEDALSVHIVLLGALLYKSRYVPRLLGAWLMLASIGFFVCA